MKNKIFREKSIARVSSPEQLNDYIKVTNPSVWLVLSAVAFLLAGICVWGIWGRLDTVLKAPAITRGKETVCYVKEAGKDALSDKMRVRLEGKEYGIDEISVFPVQISDDFPEYLVHLGDFTRGEWVYAVTLDGVCGEEGGIYEAEIVMESISPMTFVIN